MTSEPVTTELGLTVNEVLTTTRAVRKRLDLERPVPEDVIRECLELALQAPSGSNSQGWQWIVVTDSETRQALAGLYKQAWDIYVDLPFAIGNIYQGDDPETRASYDRSASSAAYLADHLAEVPAFLIPCIPADRSAPLDWMMANSSIGSVTQAAWSFMLAARDRGLGTCWTTLHLMFEQQAAEILGVPYEQIVQVALIPLAYTKGTDFKPGSRQPLDSVLHWDRWSG